MTYYKRSSPYHEDWSTDIWFSLGLWSKIQRHSRPFVQGMVLGFVQSTWWRSHILVPWKGFQRLPSEIRTNSIEGLLFLNKVVIEECSHYRINEDTGNIIRGKGRPNVAKFSLGINVNRILLLVHHPLSFHISRLYSLPPPAGNSSSLLCSDHPLWLLLVIKRLA
jgi:hypothetical protein